MKKERLRMRIISEIEIRKPKFTGKEAESLIADVRTIENSRFFEAGMGADSRELTSELLSFFKATGNARERSQEDLERTLYAVQRILTAFGFLKKTGSSR